MCVFLTEQCEISSSKLVISETDSAAKSHKPGTAAEQVWKITIEQWQVVFFFQVNFHHFFLCRHEKEKGDTSESVQSPRQQ